MFYLLVIFFFVFAFVIRRLYDIDRLGVWVLFFFVSFIGWFVFLVFFCIEGIFGSNRYGNDSKFGLN